MLTARPYAQYPEVPTVFPIHLPTARRNKNEKKFCAGKLLLKAVKCG